MLPVQCEGAHRRAHAYVFMLLIQSHVPLPHSCSPSTLMFPLRTHASISVLVFLSIVHSGAHQCVHGRIPRREHERRGHLPHQRKEDAHLDEVQYCCAQCYSEVVIHHDTLLGQHCSSSVHFHSSTQMQQQCTSSRGRTVLMGEMLPGARTPHWCAWTAEGWLIKTGHEYSTVH